MTIKTGRPVKAIFFAATIGAILSGCSTHPVVPVHEGAIDAFVEGEYALANAANLPPCLKDIPTAQLVTKQYIALSYRPGSSKYRTLTIAEAPGDGFAKSGVHVEAIPGDCKKGELATIIRPLYSHAPS
jgi:hypothetical protein